MSGHPQRGLRLQVKRSADRLAALAGLLVLSPLLLGTALAVRVGLGGPVLFRQERPGRHGRLRRGERQRRHDLDGLAGRGEHGRPGRRPLDRRPVIAGA